MSGVVDYQVSESLKGYVESMQRRIATLERELSDERIRVANLSRLLEEPFGSTRLVYREAGEDRELETWDCAACGWTMCRDEDGDAPDRFKRCPSCGARIAGVIPA